MLQACGPDLTTIFVVLCQHTEHFPEYQFQRVIVNATFKDVMESDASDAELVCKDGFRAITTERRWGPTWPERTSEEVGIGVAEGVTEAHASKEWPIRVPTFIHCTALSYPTCPHKR
jgi:hypothetical protein